MDFARLYLKHGQNLAFRSNICLDRKGLIPKAPDLLDDTVRLIRPGEIVDSDGRISIAETDGYGTAAP